MLCKMCGKKIDSGFTVDLKKEWGESMKITVCIYCMNKILWRQKQDIKNDKHIKEVWYFENK